MARISGVDIPSDKPTYISLGYLYGIGRTTAIQICRQLGLDLQRPARDLSDDDLARIANLLDKEFLIERLPRISAVCGKWPVTEAFVIGVVCRCVGSGRGRIPELARARERPWLARRA